MERIIFKHLYNYFYENDLFFKYQAGFLPGHSTVYQLIDMYDHIVKAQDEGKSCCMFFCDSIELGTEVYFLNHKLME